MKAWRARRGHAGVLPARACLDCGHFRNDAAHLEAALPGLASLGSAHACVRSDDGLCAVSDRIMSAGATCTAFAPRRSP